MYVCVRARVCVWVGGCLCVCACLCLCECACVRTYVRVRMSAVQTLCTCTLAHTHATSEFSIFGVCDGLSDLLNPLYSHHPSQHSHLCSFYHVLLILSHCPGLICIHYNLSYDGLIYCCFERRDGHPPYSSTKHGWATTPILLFCCHMSFVTCVMSWTIVTANSSCRLPFHHMAIPPSRKQWVNNSRLPMVVHSNGAYVSLQTDDAHYLGALRSDCLVWIWNSGMKPKRTCIWRVLAFDMWMLLPSNGLS